MSLLDEIQQELTSPSVSAANILRKARVLASQLRSVELQRWAKSELDGYGKNEELPAYRQMHLAAYGTIYEFGGIRRNVPIPTMMLPAELQETLTNFPVRENVAALEEIIKSDKENLQTRHPPELTEWFEEALPTRECGRAYRNLPASTQIPLLGHTGQHQKQAPGVCFGNEREQREP